MNKENFIETQSETAQWKEARRLLRRALIICITILLCGISIYLMRWNFVAMAGDISARRGDYQKAEEYYESAAEYIDVRDKLTKTRYSHAMELMNNEEYLQASEIFMMVSEYEDSAEQSSECLYLYAKELIESGENTQALGILRTLGAYKDAESIALTTAKAVFGSDYSEDYSDISSLSEEEFERRTAISERRSTMTKGRIAVGFFHTIGLKSDGTVMATGSNDYGQCEVSQWTGIRSVAAGGYFTVGLKKDGTVLFTGLDDYGQSAVSGWEDIIEISAGYNIVCGLKNDGTILTAGRGDHSVSGQWQGITSIDVGSDYVTALSNKGYALSEHLSVVNEYYSNIIDISAADSYSIGVTAGGELITASEMNLEGWTETVDIECGSNGFMAVRTDGSVKSYFFRPEYAVDTSGWEGVKELAVGGTHYAAYLEDGTVLAAGRNNCGQCAVSEWILD